MLSIMEEVYIQVEKLHNYMKDVFIGLGYPDEQAKISEGQLARYLDVDPVTAREKVEEVSQSTNITDEGKVEGYRFDFQRSLLTDV